MAAHDTLEGGLLKALGHPLRLRIITAITERGEASPVELAREFKHPLSTVSHHTRVLRDLGWIELARTEPRRGAVEHFYRAVNRPFIDDAGWERLPVPMRRGLAGQTLREIFAHAARAGANGGFDDVAVCVAYIPLELDQRGWRELSEVLTDVLQRADAIQRSSDARTSRRSGPRAAVRASNLAIPHFGLGELATRPSRARMAPPRTSGGLGCRNTRAPMLTPRTSGQRCVFGVAPTRRLSMSPSVARSGR